MTYQSDGLFLATAPVSRLNQTGNGTDNSVQPQPTKQFSQAGKPDLVARSVQAFPGRNASANEQVPSIQTTDHNAPILAQELKEITTLYNVAVAVGSSLNIQEVVWTLYKESSRLIDTSNFALAIYDEPADKLYFVLIFDQGQQVKPFAIRGSTHQGPAARILNTQGPVLIRDALEPAPALAGNAPAPERPQQPVRSWLGVPIRNPSLNEEGVQGIIATWSYQPNAFGEHELWLLSALATQTAIAIRNARLYETVLTERDRVLEVEEETRKALARDLHDGATQLVSAMSMRLDFIQMTLVRDPARLPKEIAAVQELARQTVQEIRTLLFELRPLILETQGLATALQTFIERRQADAVGTLRLSLTVKTGHPDGQLSRQSHQVEAALFAIGQEAINNALKHAQANEIVIELGETATSIYLVITDDGCGFEVDEVMQRYGQRGSLGMVNIKERAALIGGELELHSRPGQGTRVAVRVPKAEEERTRKRGATGPLSLPLNMRPEVS